MRPDPQTLEAIQTKLRESFTSEEFRRFMAWIGPDLVADLPEGGSLASLIASAVDLLVRHDRLDHRFFLSWARERATKWSCIAELASRLGVTLGNRTPKEIAADRTTRTPLLALDVLIWRGACAAIFLAIAFDARRSQNRTLTWSGAFLLCVFLPNIPSRDRDLFAWTIVVGALLLGYGKFLDSQRVEGSPA